MKRSIAALLLLITVLCVGTSAFAEDGPNWIAPKDPPKAPYTPLEDGPNW